MDPDKARENMAVLEDIISKHLDLADTTANLKKVRLALDISSKARRLISQIELDSGSAPESCLYFLSGIERMELRSRIWQNYLEFCDQRDLMPISKGDLFAKMKGLKFDMLRKTGGVYAIPPARGSRRFKELKSLNEPDNEVSNCDDS